MTSKGPCGSAARESWSRVPAEAGVLAPGSAPGAHSDHPAPKLVSPKPGDGAGSPQPLGLPHCGPRALPGRPFKPSCCTDACLRGSRASRPRARCAGQPSLGPGPGSPGGQHLHPPWARPELRASCWGTQEPISGGQGGPVSSSERIPDHRCPHPALPPPLLGVSLFEA